MMKGMFKLPSRNKNNFQNTIIGALVVGILGSALWEKVIAPFTEFAFVKISEILARFNQSITDSIYGSISRDINLALLFMIFLYAFLSLGVLLSYATKISKQIGNMVLIAKHGKPYIEYLEKTDDDFSDYDDSFLAPLKHNFSFILLSFVLFLVLCISSIYLIGRIGFIANLRQDTLANIEIVSPYVEDREYKQLKSNFYSISCEDDYEELSQKLSSIATENDLVLKE